MLELGRKQRLNVVKLVEFGVYLAKKGEEEERGERGMGMDVIAIHYCAPKVSVCVFYSLNGHLQPRVSFLHIYYL